MGFFFNETVKEAVKGRQKVESMTYNISDDLENEGSCKIRITELSNRIQAHMSVRFKLENCHRKVLLI